MKLEDKIYIVWK